MVFLSGVLACHFALLGFPDTGLGRKDGPIAQNAWSCMANVTWVVVKIMVPFWVP